MLKTGPDVYFNAGEINQIAVVTQGSGIGMF